MQQSSAAAACRSWSPLLPTDITPVLALPPLSRAALAVTRPATKCPLPLRVHQGVPTPSSERKEEASPRPSGKTPEAPVDSSPSSPGQPWGSRVHSSLPPPPFSLFCWGREGRKAVSEKPSLGEGAAPPRPTCVCVCVCVKSLSC